MGQMEAVQKLGCSAGVGGGEEEGMGGRGQEGARGVIIRRLQEVQVVAEGYRHC